MPNFATPPRPGVSKIKGFGFGMGFAPVNPRNCKAQTKKEMKMGAYEIVMTVLVVAWLGSVIIIWLEEA